MGNYENLVKKIAEHSKLSGEEVERKIEAKRAKLSGLVSKDGAAQIVAAELGINFEKEKVKISEIVDGMKKANIIGKITQVSPVRSFNKNGRDGKVVNLTVADETAGVKVVLWDTNHIGLVEQGKLKEGDVIEVSNGSVRNGELHLSSFSDIKASTQKIDNVVARGTYSEKKLKEAKIGQGIKNRAFILNMFEPRYFEVCKECGKKTMEGECKVHGKVESTKRALLNLILDDGTDSMKAVVAGNNVMKLGLAENEIFSLELFNSKKSSIIGEEKVFTGNVKNNTLYNTIELSIENIEDVNTEALLTSLEN